MPDRLNVLSAREVHILAGLGPHTRGHVLAVLSRFPALTLTSGRRTAERNRQVGGAPRSFHLAGRAADFAGPAQTLDQAARWIRTHRLTPRCTGPEEVLVHNSGSGLHLHGAW